MSGWSKPTSETASRIGDLAVARLIHHGVFALTEPERSLISRACALAADEVLDDLLHEADKTRRDMVQLMQLVAGIAPH